MEALNSGQNFEEWRAAHESEAQDIDARCGDALS
jgi:hypothetical protein